VLAGPLRAASVFASAIVILSFALFALDETSTARRGLPALVALLVYSLLLSFLARWARGLE
jgi:uncharacterized membrane protein